MPKWEGRFMQIEISLLVQTSHSLAQQNLLSKKQNKKFFFFFFNSKDGK